MYGYYRTTTVKFTDLRYGKGGRKVFQRFCKCCLCGINFRRIIIGIFTIPGSIDTIENYVGPPGENGTLGQPGQDGLKGAIGTKGCTVCILYS